MNEFYNRISIQRKVIKMINSSGVFRSPLNGLTKDSIELWIRLNKVNEIKLINIVYEISSKMLLLANKSQEQITEEYSCISDNVNNCINELQELLFLKLER